MSARQTAESFWARVDKTGPCWVWQGTCTSAGYGCVSWVGATYTAHRVAAWLVGMVESPSAPTDHRAPAFVLHTCDNRRCCNPAHFFLGNYATNLRDAYKKQRKTQPRGAKHINAKLTNAQAAKIRSLYAAGQVQTVLAAKFNVSQVTISLIVRNKTYICPK